MRLARTAYTAARLGSFVRISLIGDRLTEAERCSMRESTSPRP